MTWPENTGCNIPCECGKLFIGKTCSSSETGVNEQRCHIRLHQSEKSVVTEHSIDLGHRISLKSTSILANTWRRSAWLVREGVDTELHPNNMYREDGFCLNKQWKPLIRSLKERRKKIFPKNGIVASS